ncbi:protein kinase family protein, partial [Streptomyces litchfieldiae]
RVIDFGIARALDAVQHSTGIFGTPGYMSPEQARGHPTGPASDVFSLACVLTYAATTHSPYGEAPAAEVIYRIVNSEPELRGVPAPFAGLLAACLAKDPAARPSLADILQHFAEPAQPARPVIPWLPPDIVSMISQRQAAERTEGRVGRPGRRAVLATAALGALAAIGVPVGIGLASRAGDDTDDTDGTGGDAPREGVDAAVTLIPAATLDLGSIDSVPALTYSPDGAMLAVSAVEADVSLWDMASRREIATLSVSDSMGISDVAFGRNGLLAVGYVSDRGMTLGDLVMDIGAVKLWEISSRGAATEVTTLYTESEGQILEAMTAVAVSPDGTTVAGARNGHDCIGKVPVWDISSRELIHTLVVGAGRGTDISAVRSVAFSPDGRTLAAGYGYGLKGGVALWDVPSYSPIATIPLENTDAFGVASLAFSPDGRTLAGSFGGVALWDVPSHSLIASLHDMSDYGPAYQSVAFSPDGSTVAGGWSAGSSGGEVTLWNALSHEKIVSVAAGRSGAGDLVFSPDGETLAAAIDTDELLSTIQLWTVE